MVGAENTVLFSFLVVVCVYLCNIPENLANIIDIISGLDYCLLCYINYDHNCIASNMLCLMKLFHTVYSRETPERIL